MIQNFPVFITSTNNNMGNLNDQKNKKIPLKDFQVLLKEAWDIYYPKFLKIIGLQLLPLIPLALFSSLVLFLGISMFSNLFSKSDFAQDLIYFGLLVFILFLVLIYFMSVFITAIYIILQDSEGKVTLSQAIRKSFKHALPFFWVYFLSGLAMFFGLILFIIPGILIAVLFSFSKWAYVLEGFRGTKALKRSKELIDGYFGDVLGRYLVIAIPYVLFPSMVGILTSNSSSINSLFFAGPLILVFQIFNFLLPPFIFTYILVIYRDLYRIKGQSTIQK
ncbi:hypothetical protein C0584_00105 [Candidatus Parcubacteria bacterium]|nr:MAG: hypothetical protein C0584_00105 [Candidatus Parcubacteria bacterium]